MANLNSVNFMTEDQFNNIIQDDNQLYAVRKEILTATKSFGQNGWCKLSNGLIVQWGHTSNISDTDRYILTFPTAFTYNSYGFSYVIDVNRSDSNYAHCAYSRRTTQVSVFDFGIKSDNAGAFWIAIGY